jgi:hypothetical protein
MTSANKPQDILVVGDIDHIDHNHRSLLNDIAKNKDVIVNPQPLFEPEPFELTSYYPNHTPTALPVDPPIGAIGQITGDYDEGSKRLHKPWNDSDVKWKCHKHMATNKRRKANKVAAKQRRKNR